MVVASKVGSIASILLTLLGVLVTLPTTTHKPPGSPTRLENKLKDTTLQGSSALSFFGGGGGGYYTVYPLGV